MNVSQAVRSLAEKRDAVKNVALTVSLLAISGAAMAQEAPTSNAGLKAVLAKMMLAMADGVATIFEEIVPILVLTFGVGYAWKWVRKI